MNKKRFYKDIHYKLHGQFTPLKKQMHKTKSKY